MDEMVPFLVRGDGTHSRHFFYPKGREQRRKAVLNMRTMPRKERKIRKDICRELHRSIGEIRSMISIRANGWEEC